MRISSAPEDLSELGPLLDDRPRSDAVGDVPALLELAKAAAETAPNPGEGGPLSCGRSWPPLPPSTSQPAGSRTAPGRLAILAQAGRPRERVEGWECPDF